MTIRLPAPETAASPHDAEADTILLQALLEAIASLVALARSPNRRTAQRTLNALLR